MDDAESTVTYAPWRDRFGAWLLDVVVLFGALLILGWALYFVAGGPDDDPATDDAAAIGALLFFPLVLVAPVYFALFHGGERGQTLGKRAPGIAVRRCDTLGRLSYPAAFGRAFVFAVFWLFYIWMLDILWPLWDERSQALHDKIAGSVAVKVDR